MKVVLESPYGGTNKERNRCYAQRCMHHSLMLDESPIAFHLLYTQVLDADDAPQRKRGIDLSQRWYEDADAVAVYMDFGITKGMQQGIDLATKLGLPIQMRSIIYEGLGYTGKGFRTYWNVASGPAREHVDQP